MIHDVLLSCVNLTNAKSPLEELLLSQAAQEFMHPCEINVLVNISAIVNLYRDIAKFTRLYGSIKRKDQMFTNDAYEPLKEGKYLKALANGISRVLDDYYGKVAELERKHLENPLPSLLFVYQELQLYEPLAIFLRKLVRGVQMQKLHGCSILQYIHQNTPTGDNLISKAMKIIESTVNVIFIKQLAFWTIYAKIDDEYDEFFIQCTEARIDSDGVTSNSSEKHCSTTTLSDAASTCADIWRYEILDNFLPLYLSSIWAEKVLFIGQTVLLFKYETSKTKKYAQIWNSELTRVLECEDSLWEGKSHSYFAKLQELQYDDEIIVSQFENVIEDIKSYVTNRLSEIAVNQADLGHHLRLVKEFFLLGRGELFLEFIRKTYVIERDENNKNKLRDFVKAYQSAANCVGVADLLEQFSLGIINADEDDLHEFGRLQHVKIEYKIDWPLHLLFSPTVIDRYNILFRFLLLIKKMQYDLHMVWWKHTRESKINGPTGIKEMHLRNQLMFFIDNLQYYILVDVLESQFSVLMNTIHLNMDFEHIQRSHSVFLANILSLCFLLTDEDDFSTELCSNNRVHLILNELFHICADFCNLFDSNKSVNGKKSIDELDDRFGILIKELLTFLNGVKTSSNTSPLSQLLLRLDFNYWFSLERTTSIQ